MGRTPDRRAGPLIEEDIILDDVTGSEPGALEAQIYYASGAFVFEDSGGIFDPRAGGALPSATAIGQVMLSIDGSTFTKQTPIMAEGWLSSSLGVLIVCG